VAINDVGEPCVVDNSRLNTKHKYSTGMESMDGIPLE
jgi:hypothetical protein